MLVILYDQHTHCKLLARTRANGHGIGVRASVLAKYDKIVAMKLAPEPKDCAEIDALRRIAARCAPDITGFEAALKDFRKLLPIVAPSPVARMPPGEEAQRALAFAMFREVGNRAPRSGHDWRPKPLPKPERNGPGLRETCGILGI